MHTRELPAYFTIYRFFKHRDLDPTDVLASIENALKFNPNSAYLKDYRARFK